MAFILFLALTLSNGESVYQQYRADSSLECRELAVVVAREYHRVGLLDGFTAICFAGWEV